MEIEEKFGIIVLLDALGVQNSSIEESRHFVELLKEAQKTFEPFIRSMIRSSDSATEHLEGVIPTTRTFGDTLLLAWELPSESSIFDYIDSVSTTVGFVIQQGVEQGILFRGAMSIGRYLESETTIIGPAITDAASWHEQANWFGCIATPNCSMRINTEVAGQPHYSIIRHEVPLKSSDKIELWCVNWPNIIRALNPDAEETMWFYKNISKFNIPIGTEEKYVNSESFLKACAQKRNLTNQASETASPAPP